MSAPTPAKLREARRLKGVPLRAMARALRVSHVYLLDMERGHRPMPEEVRSRYNATLQKPNARSA